MFEPGSKVDQYKLISVLGTGGMGTVMLAEDTKLRRRAALKFLAKELCSDTEHLERFMREARAASSLNHPNICTIYDINTAGDNPYIAMEYVEGEPLSTMIRRCPRSARETVDIAIQISDALRDAHSKGIIHRDIKPSNVIVTARGRVKILDFGLAKKMPAADPAANEKSVTRPGMILGTASYMSPEQARGLEIDARTDLWSLGVTIYEMLTGKLPYFGETIADTLASVLTAEHVPPTEVIEDLPSDLDTLIGQLLAKRPEKRYADTGSLLNDLNALAVKLAGDPNGGVPASPRTTDEKTQVFAYATTDVAPRMVTGEEIRERNLRPNNLSRVVSPIIGREKEIRELISLLRSDRQLVTMTGIGGTGKTRLARAVAEEMLTDFTDGVYFVDLASITDPELVMPALAKPFGINDGGTKPVYLSLSEHLAQKDLLLVIDNLEQVLESASDIGELLASAKMLKVLATSRSLLRLSFELEYPVPPLSVPAGGEEDIPLADVLHNAAVRLFETRAIAVKPSFRLDASNAFTVAKICGQLDGLPLAIELAAARIRILSPESILSRLDDRLQLLSGGSRDLPDRHRTIRDMIDWSYSLLNAQEKAMFRMLSVFAGGFSIESAEAVCGNDGELAAAGSNGQPNILDLVASLSEKSLLNERTDKSGEPRFRMLEVVRDLASEMLERSGRSDELRERYATFFAETAENAEPMIQAAAPGKLFTKFEVEHDNVRAAMRWALQHKPAIAVRIAAAMRNFWLLHGHLTEAYGLLRAASNVAVDSDPGLRFKIFSALGLSARFRGELELSSAAYEAGLAAGEAAGDRSSVAAANRGLGLVAMQQSKLSEAREFFDRGLAISRELKDDFGIAMSLSFLGDLTRVENRHSEALPMFEEAVELFRRLDRRVALGDALNNLASVTFVSGDTTSAATHFLEAANIAVEVGNKITLSHSLDGFAAINTEHVDLIRAARLSGAADKLRSEVGYQNEPAEKAFRDEYFRKLQDKMDAEDFQAEYQKGKEAIPEELIIP